jgi:hypothetical protein
MFDHGSIMKYDDKLPIIYRDIRDMVGMESKADVITLNVPGSGAFVHDGHYASQLHAVPAAE